MRKDVLIAGIVGIAAVGIGAYALTRNSGTKQTTTGTSVIGYGGGATGGYSEPTTADTVRTVLETVMSSNNIEPLGEIAPEMEDMMNPSDESADVRQKTSLAADHVTSRATGESMYSLQTVYSSKGGETAGHTGGTRRSSTVNKAIENEG